MQLLLLYLVIKTVQVLSFDVKVDPLVLTQQGLVLGQRAEDGDYSSFLGIPYATVDADKPFGPALPHPGFGDEVFNANDGSLVCPQSLSSETNQAIDCLKLNVYSPNLSNSRNLLPVFVFIHGGRFSAGRGGEFGASKIVQHGIVVVTINYRLGPYGFFCLDSPSAPGNQGFKDQYQALQWIKNNINAFGGDPDNITMGGQSAGAMSVLQHLYSPHAKLYHKVIAQSGVPLSLNLRDEGDTEAAVKMAQYLGFNTSDTELALDFLASTPHQLVTGASENLGLQLFPCTENVFDGVDSFLTTNRYSISDQAKVRNTPILIGNTEMEFGKVQSSSPEDLKSQKFYDILRQASDLTEEQLINAARIVENFYVGDEDLLPNTQYQNEFLSDFEFNHPIQRTITDLLAANANPIYEYVFSFSENGLAGHSDEMPYMDNNDWENEEQHLLSERITTLWANFIKYGNPTPEVTELLPITWTAVSGETRPYLVIDKDLYMKSRFRRESMAFWDMFYTANQQ